MTTQHAGDGMDGSGRWARYRAGARATLEGQTPGAEEPVIPLSAASEEIRAYLRRAWRSA